MMPTFSFTYICFNEKPDGKIRKKYFTDSNVRKALAYLTPVDNIITLQYKQYSKNCKRMVSTLSPFKKGFNKKLLPIPFDLEKATNLLRDAGWKDSDNDGILEKEIDGKKTDFSVDLYYVSSSAEWKNIALLISETFAKAGVRINALALYIKMYVEKAKAHDFDLLLGSFAAPGIEEDFSQLWHSSSWLNHGSNYSGFGTSETDSIIETIKSTTVDSLRYQLSEVLQQKIYDDQPFVFLYTNLRRNIIHKRFGNQMLFSEKPGVLYNMLRLLSINKGITMTDDVNP